MAELTVEAKLENLDVVISFLTSTLKSYNICKKNINKIELVCEEVVVNIMKYAYSKSKGSLTLIIDYESKAKNLFIQIIDSGIPFNPLLMEEPDVAMPLEDRKIGGMGIFIIRKTMDEVDYERINGKNVLNMKIAIK